MEEDYYSLLGLKTDSTQKEIRKSYYVKALKYHPDKTGPDDKEATKIFLKLTKAYDVLSDPQKKREYDDSLKAKFLQKAKIDRFDSKRKKMKEDLDLRENAYKRQKKEDAMSEAQLRYEINRLREEGLRILREDQNAEINNKNDKSSESETQISDIDKTLKLKWKRKKFSFDTESIKSLFEKYGEIEHIIGSLKGKGNALIQFKSIYTAYSVMLDNEKKSNSDISMFDISWAGKKEPEIIKKLSIDVQMKKESENKNKTTENGNNINSNKSYTEIPIETEKNPKMTNNSTSGFSFNPGISMSMDDYENYTLMKMRKMEREKMKEQILKEEEEAKEK